MHDTNRTLIFVIVVKISGLITINTAVVFIIAVLTIISYGYAGIIEATLRVEAFGIFVAEGIILYTLYVFIVPGTKYANRYDGRSSYIEKLEVLT